MVGREEFARESAEKNFKPVTRFKVNSQFIIKEYEADRFFFVCGGGEGGGFNFHSQDPDKNDHI